MRWLLSLALVLLLAVPASAVQLYVFARMDGGSIAEPFPLTQEGYGISHIVTIGATGWGLYAINGKRGDLLAWVGATTVVPIAYRTRSGDIRWVEADEPIEPAVRTRINNWLASHGHGDIQVPAGMTKKVLMKRVLDRFVRSVPEWSGYDLDIEAGNDSTGSD